MNEETKGQEDEETLTPDPESQGQDPKPEAPEAPETETKTFDEDYVKSIRAEAAKYRKELREAQAKVEAFEKEKMSESERLTAERDQAKARVDELETRLRLERVGSIIRAKAAELGFHNPTDATDAIDISSLELDDEGVPDGRSVTALVKALAKEKPYLVKELDSGAGDGGPTDQPEPETIQSRISKEEQRLLDEGGFRIPV